MAVSPLTAQNPAASAASRVPSGFSSMSSEDFIKIIFTELSNQDPFQPNDSAALLEQLNSIRSIESDLKISDQIKSLVQENQFASASTMIGKGVIGLNEDNTRVSGIVQSVIREGDTVTLQLNTGWLLPVGNVEQIVNVTPAPQAAPSESAV